MMKDQGSGVGEGVRKEQGHSNEWLACSLQEGIYRKGTTIEPGGKLKGARLVCDL
jgi:hypothetical protein